MKYSSGETVHLWDRVEVWTGNRGIVVFSIDTDEFSADFPKESWDYLGRGVMFDTEHAGLVHYDQSDEDIRFVSRGGPPTPEETECLRRFQAEALKKRHREGR